MKSFLNYFLVFGILIAVSPLVAQDSLLIVSLNIRLSGVDDGQNNWIARKSLVQDYILNTKPDILCVQEAKLDQIQYLDSIPEYEYVGVGRDNGMTEGEYCAIFSRITKVKILESGNFWLSETPKTPSFGWDAACKRICTWIKLKTKENEFYVFNTHFDHLGEKARIESARLINGRITLLNPSYPVILTGDFNSLPGSMPINIISDFMQDARESALKKDTSNGLTYTGFANLQTRIDYIFVKPGMKVLRFNTYQTQPGGRYISDHCPVESLILVQDSKE